MAFDTVWVDGLFKQVHDLGITGRMWRLLYRCSVDFKCCVRIQGHVSDWYKLSCGIHQGGYKSLIKYTIFINSLLTELKESGLCCKIYRTPSTPLGYADDLAAYCTSKQKLDSSKGITCPWVYLAL